MTWRKRTVLKKHCPQRVEKAFSPPRGAGIHRRPSRFPCALRPEIGGATGRKNLFFPLPLLSELVKVLIIFDFNGAGNPSWVSRAHLSFPLRKSLLAAHRPFPLLGLSPRQEPPCGGCAPKRACGRSPAHTLHPQGVCSIRKAAKPLTAALPYRRGGFTTLSTVSGRKYTPSAQLGSEPAADFTPAESARRSPC